MQAARYLFLAMLFAPIVGCATAESVDDSTQPGAIGKGGATASTAATGVVGTSVAAKGGGTGVIYGGGVGGSTGVSTAAKGGTVGLTTTSRAPSCTDKLKNGDETDVDCGGSCDTKCAFGKTCATAADCDATIGVCSESLKCTTCETGVKDGNETDVDCGGSCATKCAEGKGCAVRSDCATYNCDSTTLLCGVMTNCLASIPTECACASKTTDSNVAGKCDTIIKCYLDNDCTPSTSACVTNDGLCGVNTLKMDSAPVTVASSVYTCACGS
jgi:hypothetical protein